MEIQEQFAAEAFGEGFRQFPQFREYGPRLVWRPLAQGGAWMLAWDNQPPRETPGAWDFQNVVVKTYRRLAGV